MPGTPARATITLPGLPVGAVTEVDPDSPYVADCLARGYLVREPAAEPETIAPTADPAGPGHEQAAEPEVPDAED